MLSNYLLTTALSLLLLSFVYFICFKKLSLYLDIAAWDPEIIFIIYR